VIPDGSDPTLVDDPVTQYVPTARPGSRAPHVWLERGGEPISTIDLLGRNFVLLTGSQGAAWVEVATQLAARRELSLDAHIIGDGGAISDPDDAWLSAYGIEPDGAVLVRPDGYVAWRSKTHATETEQTLKGALDGILCLAPTVENARNC
jgi:putative polyketide hydroxylase